MFEELFGVLKLLVVVWPLLATVPVVATWERRVEGVPGECECTRRCEEVEVGAVDDDDDAENMDAFEVARRSEGAALDDNP